MTTASKLLLVFILGLFACSSTDTSTKGQNKSSGDIVNPLQADTISYVHDTIKRFIVDDYPVTDEMLDDKTSKNSSYPKQSGELHSYDKAWFTNETLDQTLVLEMYTDKHRLVTFHFYNYDIADALIDRMELHVNGDFASLAQKKKNFRGFIYGATNIDKKYFTTYKGFQLGDSKDKALKVYGMPESITTTDGVEKLYWDFLGDVELYDSTFRSSDKPLAKNSLGHQTTMFFRKNKLIGIIFHNDIP